MSKRLQLRGGDLATIFSHKRSKAYRDLMSQWVALLKARLLRYVKENSKSWFNAAYKARDISFNVRYDIRRQRLRIFGVAPNANVGKTMMSSVKRSSIPKSERNPIFVPYSRIVHEGGVWHRKEAPVNGVRGFFFTPKKQTQGVGNVFFARTALTDYTPEGRSAPKATFRYPVAWTASGGEPFFLRQNKAASDFTMPAFNQIAKDAFDAVVKRNRIEAVNLDEYFNQIFA